MNTEEKMMHMFNRIHGEAGGSFTYEVYDSDDGYYEESAGVICLKDGRECWRQSKLDILFEYLTIDM